MLNKLFSGLVEVTPVELPETPVEQGGKEVSPEDVGIDLSSLVSIDDNIPKFNPEIAEWIEQALDDENLEGLDYFEYRKVLLSLGDSGPKQKYQTAYVAVKALGLTVNKINETASHYLKVIQNKKQEFVSTKLKDAKAVYDQAQTKKTNLDNIILEKKKELAKIKEEIEALNIQTIEATAESDDAKSDYNILKQDTTITFDYALKQIKDDIDNISLYIVE